MTTGRVDEIIRPGSGGQAGRVRHALEDADARACG
jgi:hypothetical protein